LITGDLPWVFVHQSRDYDGALYLDDGEQILLPPPKPADHLARQTHGRRLVFADQPTQPKPLADVAGIRSGNAVSTLLRVSKAVVLLRSVVSHTTAYADSGHLTRAQNSDTLGT